MARTIATINDPRNAWLFDRKFHVDVALNQADILASLEEAGERQAIRSALNGRRIAYLGGLAAATAAGAAGALVFATRSRRTRLAG